ncbi:MAG TPA: YebC/PmpR family DNA-binding transcriptional regulator [Acidimicrobiia bacterium]|jgi:YebC/PmpR family DNA-binding regulatory protein|nr:YebC/PmpR family DNA-binding transcriptional regulator [Acidimicrobiia bacterium]
MSGHSKWATTKHQKAAKDKVRGKLFAKLIRQVEVAAREGGGDLSANATLRGMVDKARDASVPLDTIERAIKRGTGELEGVTYESVTYEGYASNGVAVIVEVLTDNRNRTTSEVKNVFTRNGGSLAEPGAVAWQFQRKGMIIIDKTSGVDEDELMLAALEAGAEDVADQGDTFDITTAPTDFTSVRAALSEAGIALASADLTMVATTAVPLATEADARKVLRVLDALEDNDDVQNVYANFDIPDEIFQAVSAE